MRRKYLSVRNQKSDKDLTLIRQWVEKGEKPELKEITGESITVKSMWAQFDQLSTICIGALFFLFGGFFCEQNEQPATYNFTSFCKPGQ
jgi:hypothetical protein